MRTYVGLLRAVNLAGLNRVAMADLRTLLDTMCMHDVRTLLQSGNVVFRSEAMATALEPMLAAATAARLGVTTEYFVRTAREWRSIVNGNPFPTVASADPGHLLVMCLQRAPLATAAATLRKAINGPEVVRVKGREAYITYPDGIGRSRLTTAVIEKHLGVRGTARNWNTVLKLDALVAEG